MSSVGERLGSAGFSRLARLAATLGLVVALLVLLPTAMTYINPGHVGIVIHRVGGGVDATPLASALAVSATMRSAPTAARMSAMARSGSSPARAIAAESARGSSWRSDSSSCVSAQNRPRAAAASAASASVTARGWAAGSGK